MSIDIATLRPKLEAALGAQLQLGALLGQGGFAAVFRAHDPFLERDVAIKVLDPSLAVDAAREEQFLQQSLVTRGRAAADMARAPHTQDSLAIRVAENAPRVQSAPSRAQAELLRTAPRYTIPARN